MQLDKPEYIGTDFTREAIDTPTLAKMKFTDCRFRWTDFRNVELFFHCTFENCDFSNARLGGTTMRDCAFLSCNFSHTSFFAATLTDCKLTGSSLEDADCASFQVENCDFSYVNLRKQTFIKHDFHNTRFFCADLAGCIFNQCDLRNCIFDEAAVFQTGFFRSDLRGASLQAVELGEINFKEAVLDLSQSATLAAYLTGCVVRPD